MLSHLSAALLSFAMVIWLVPYFIKLVKLRKFGAQPIRDDGPATHFSKKGTPTMGGLVILVATLIATNCLVERIDPQLLIVMLSMCGFSLLGAGDDYRKIAKNSHRGLSAKAKITIELLFSLLITYLVQFTLPIEQASHLFIPFGKGYSIDLGLGYYLFGFLVIAGTANASNLTDGLDGLSSKTMLVNAVFWLLLIVTATKVPDSIELSNSLVILLSAAIGALLAFLWFNGYPAQIFMGDTGSLAFGAMFGTIAMLIKLELLLLLVGGVWVAETMSVMLQVMYFKLTKGKRIFLMAPLHHHFEKLGWPETKVVMRFWIINVLLAIMAWGALII